MFWKFNISVTLRSISSMGHSSEFWEDIRNEILIRTWTPWCHIPRGHPKWSANHSRNLKKHLHFNLVSKQLFRCPFSLHFLLYKILYELNTKKSRELSSIFTTAPFFPPQKLDSLLKMWVTCPQIEETII